MDSISWLFKQAAEPTTHKRHDTYIVMSYVVMSYIVMCPGAQETWHLYRYSVCSYSVFRYGLYTYGLYASPQHTRDMTPLLGLMRSNNADPTALIANTNAMRSGTLI